MPGGDGWRMRLLTPDHHLAVYSVDGALRDADFEQDWRRKQRRAHAIRMSCSSAVCLVPDRGAS